MNLRVLTLAAMAVLLCHPGRSAESPLNFEEVFRLVRTNLTDLSEAELSRMAAEGLIKELGARVRFAGETAGEAEQAAAVPRSAVYADVYGYVRVGHAGSDLPERFQQAFRSLVSTNGLKGLVLDLRYASGQNYEAAMKVVDLFLSEERPLLQVAGREIRSTAKNSALDLPMAVLVNGETRGAAEAMAAVLRETQAALVIGSPTAGDTRLFQDFTLSTGQSLRVGTAAVQLPGGQRMAGNGLAPDIRVTVAAEHEKRYFEDPYAAISPLPADGDGETANSATNRARPFNEAELMRRHREGISIDPTAELFEDNDRPQVITDPALARGLDFLKGVSVLRPL